jgi:hypothetical protein
VFEIRRMVAVRSIAILFGEEGYCWDSDNKPIGIYMISGTPFLIAELAAPVEFRGVWI